MNTRLFVPVATLSTQDIIPIIKFRIQKNNQLEKIFNKESKPTLGTDLRVMQQINFTENLECTGRTKMLFVFEEVRKTILGF